MTPLPSTRHNPSDLTSRVDDPERLLRQPSTQTLHFQQRSIKQAGRYDSDITLFATAPPRPVPASAKPYAPPNTPPQSTSLPGTFPASPLPRSRLSQILREEERLGLDLNVSANQPTQPPPPHTFEDMVGGTNEGSGPVRPSTDELLRALLEAQVAGVRAANEAAERQARLEENRLEAALEAEERVAELEERLLNFQLNATNQSQSNPPADPVNRGLDLAKFKSSDGPQFKGPYRDTEEFLKWFTSLKIFFLVKKVDKDTDRIILTGSYLLKTNLQAFWAHNINTFQSISWDDFKERLFRAALPTDWNDKLREKILTLRMSLNEDFKFYCTRARSIQSLMNHDRVEIDDFTLASHMVLGFLPELKSMLRLEGPLKKDNFEFLRFEERCDLIYKDLVIKKILNRRAIPSLTN